MFERGELFELWRIAKERQAFKDWARIRDGNRVNRKGELTHFIGLLGEEAFARAFGFKIDRSLYGRGVRSHDFLLDGVRVEVKTSTRELKFQEGKFVSDIAVLAQYREYHEVNLMGWVTRGDFSRECRREDFGYGECLVMHPSQLCDMRKLRSYTQALSFVRAIDNKEIVV